MRLRSFFYSSSAVFLGLIFFSSGMGKLFAGHRFPGLIGPVWLADELAKYGLAFFAQFIAVAQVVVGLLVLTPRYRTLGAVMLVPMLVNILVVTISLQWRGTPYVVSFLLLLNLGLLLHDRHWLLPLLSGQPAELPATLPRRGWQGHLAWLAGLSLALGGAALSYALPAVSYGVVLAGVGLAWLSSRWDG